MENEKKLLISTFQKYRSKLEDSWDKAFYRMSKLAGRSEIVRKEGNALYNGSIHGAQIHLQILSLYSRSIAMSPDFTEDLALGYGNRSAFLLHMGKYQECIQDIDRALEVTSSNVLKVKLFCRKVKCLKLLGLSGYEDVLEETKSCIDNIGENQILNQQLINMMNEVKDFSNNDERNTVKEDATRAEFSKILSDKESEDVLHSVDIKCDKRFGRHLVAAKDFQPGDIIFVEKLYATDLNTEKYQSNCYNCLKNCWSGIPCDFCTWAMFCSEACKTEAWEKFHNIECFLMPHLYIMSENYTHRYMSITYRICLKILLMGINEAGSISKLEDEIKSIDEYSETTHRGFLQNGKIVSNTIKSIYTLKGKETTSCLESEKWAVTAIHVLIALVKQSSLFGESIKSKGMSDLMKNEKVIFLGSLFIKLIKIKQVNGHTIANFAQRCEQSNDRCIKDDCCERGSCIAPLACLINHSCFPNVSRCFTEDKKIIIFATQPIKKNSQIFDSYMHAFYNSPIKKRKEFAKSYGFTCNCPACSENWPIVFNLPKPKTLQKKHDATPKSPLEIELINNCKQVLTFLNDGKTEFDLGSIKTLSEAITKATDCLKQPSETTCLMIDALCKVFSHVYGLELESIEQCKNK